MTSSPKKTTAFAPLQNDSHSLEKLIVRKKPQSQEKNINELMSTRYPKTQTFPLTFLYIQDKNAAQVSLPT